MTLEATERIQSITAEKPRAVYTGEKAVTKRNAAGRSGGESLPPPRVEEEGNV